MPSTASSFERRLAAAIGAALHDAELERSQTQIVFFFDADVVAGSLFARSKIEDDINRQIPFTRSVVRALWLQGRLPRVRLTIPHLLELQHVLRSIQECGGVESYLRQQRDEISRQFGLASAERAREHLIQLFRTLPSMDAGDEDHLAELIDNLGMEEFAVIEAELAASAFYEKQLLERQIDLDGDLGESERHIANQDYRFEDVVVTLSRMRPGRVSPNRSDAASLLAIARLWARDRETRTEYRFYTQTDVIRLFCEEMPPGRQLMTKPALELPMGLACTDSTVSAVRSSTYFILRAAFPSLGFYSSGDDPEQCQERLMLEHAAASLLQPTTERGDYSTASLRIAEIASGIMLSDLILCLRNRSFTKQMLTLTGRRERVLESLSRLSHSIQGMGDLRERLIKHADKVNEMLVADAGRFARSISATVIARNIRVYLLGVDVPSEEECKLSLRRWSAVFSSQAANAKALERLLEMCYPPRPTDTSWGSAALDKLRSYESLDDAFAVIVPLLTLGEYEAPLQFFEQCAELQTDRLCGSLLALKTWALSLSPIPAVETLLESWTEFWDSLGPLEDTTAPRDAESRRRDRYLMAAWVAVYVSSGLRYFPAGDGTSAGLSQVVTGGNEYVDRFLEAQQPEDPLFQMAWAAKLFLLANETWCAGDVGKLNTALNECQEMVKEEPCLYLTNARCWAAYAIWQKGRRDEQTLGAELAKMRNVAFEPFQVAVRDAMRSGS